jgi:hypothetical protein
MARADEFYKTAVVPYKDKALARALSSDTPDEIYSQFIRVGRSGAGEDRAIKFYDALDPKGKAAVRYGMLRTRWTTRRSRARTRSARRNSRSRWRRSRRAPASSSRARTRKALDGFVNLMRHAERFGQYTENPPTGQRLIPLVSLLGAAAWPKLAAAIGGGALVRARRRRARRCAMR